MTQKRDLEVYISTVLGGIKSLDQPIATDVCVCDQEGCWFCIQKLECLLPISVLCCAQRERGICKS